MTPEVGNTIETILVRDVSAEGMKVWAKILRDPNPIHLDPAVVCARGLGDRVINQGPANLAYLISAVQRTYPDAMLESLNVQYVANVFAGDSLEAGGKVTDTAPGDGCLHVTCEIWLRVPDRGSVITGTARVVLPTREL